MISESTGVKIKTPKNNGPHLFKKEIIALFSNLYPENNEYLKTRDQYRAYLLVYLLIFIFYISQ